jgi:single-stranded-DNA-specific exonuclease
VALVNPKLADDFHYLCTGGVVFKVSHALLKYRPVPGFDLRRHLDLVALATVADIVPIVDENRIFVRRGLMQVDQTINLGIRELKQIATVGSPARTYDVSFKLGPRLNAAGRLDTAEVSLELLLTSDPVRARTLAFDLDQRNRDRQNLEQTTRDEAEAMIEALPPEDRTAGIVVGQRGWHPGVVGIVASRVMKNYHRPTFIIGIDEDGIGKGSGRSVPGISLIAAINACQDLLEAGGGHDMAAGLSIREENIPEFRKRFGAHIAGIASDDLLQPRLDIDAEAALGDLTVELLDSYELLRPFGNANPQPIFMSRAVKVMSEPRVIKEKHLKLKLSQNGVSRDAMYFNGAGQELPRPPWDIAYTIDRNDYRGQIGVTIAIQAVRKAEGK